MDTKTGLSADGLSSEIPKDVDTRTDAERETEAAIAAENRDTAGAALVSAEGEGPIGTRTAVMSPEATPVLGGEPADWSDVLIVANAPDRMPPKKDRKVIVAERRGQPTDETSGGGLDTTATYPKNADAYVGYAQLDEEGEEHRVFPDAGDAPVFLMGKNVKQFGISGLSRQPGFLSVGPAHPVYVAVNLAHQKGAKNVEIHGLSDHDKVALAPFLDKIAPEFDTLAY